MVEEREDSSRAMRTSFTEDIAAGTPSRNLLIDKGALTDSDKRLVGHESCIVEAKGAQSQNILV